MLYILIANFINACLVDRNLQKCADPERGQGSGTPHLEYHKNEFLSNTSLDPLKNHKAAKPAFNVGSSYARQRNAFNGVSLVG